MTSVVLRRCKHLRVACGTSTVTSQPLQRTSRQSCRCIRHGAEPFAKLYKKISIQIMPYAKITNNQGVHVTGAEKGEITRYHDIDTVWELSVGEGSACHSQAMGR